jgi:hypothetical protein
MEVCRVPLPCTLSGKRTNAVQYTKTGEVYRVDCRKPIHRDRRLAGMLEMAPPLTDTAILGLPGGSWTALPAIGPTWAVFSIQTGPRLPRLSWGRHSTLGGWVRAERAPTATAIAMSHGSQPVRRAFSQTTEDERKLTEARGAVVMRRKAAEGGLMPCRGSGVEWNESTGEDQGSPIKLKKPPGPLALKIRSLHVLRLAGYTVHVQWIKIPCQPRKKPRFRADSVRSLAGIGRADITSNVYPNGFLCPFPREALWKTAASRRRHV